MVIESPSQTANLVIVPSRISGRSQPDDLEGIEEAEITAEISVPAEGGWGWVVVAASFICTFLLDGVFFTFGSIYPDIIEDMQIQPFFVALMNSIAVALYFITGPITSALINRFGFRACTMFGSIVISLSFFCSYFSTDYIALLIFYGVFSGFGGCLVAMSSGIVVGFYFERLRALALALAGAGSSIGIMIMFSVNSYLVNLAGWRLTTLLHSGLFGTMYFLAMTYRPLLSLNVTKTTTDPTRTITYLPSLATTATVQPRKDVAPTPTERLFSAVSNINFPTASTVVEQRETSTIWQAGPSTAGVSKLTLKARSPQSGISRRQLKQVHSIMSRASVQTDSKNVEITVTVPEAPSPKRKWWKQLFHWEDHIPESRPMYRDDAFYDGRLEKLSVYQKSKLDTTPETRTGLEYQMAVSRAVTTADLKERSGICSTAVRRILATMMDPKLLKRCSFLIICSSGFLTYIGLLIPYVFLTDRNKSEGIDPKHCSLFVSVIGFSNAIGRLVAGILACKYSPIKLYLSSTIVAGVGTMAYNFSFNVIYQYFICMVFGCFIASISSLRAMVLVDLYGLEKLTNATGMLLMFQGFGSLLSTPLSSVLKGQFGYTVSFYVAGLAILISGFILIPVRTLVTKENKRLHIDDKDNVTSTQNAQRDKQHVTP